MPYVNAYAEPVDAGLRVNRARIGASMAARKKPVRKKGEKLAAYTARLDAWRTSVRIDVAFRKRARPFLHGVGHERSRAWRIAEAERRVTGSDEDQW